MKDHQSSMRMKITIERDGQRFGPYTEADAREYLRTGRLKSWDLAYGGKSVGWVTLSKLLDSPASSNFAAPPPPSSSQISPKIPKIVTVIGSVLLCLGAFTPVGSIPVLGGINFISLGWPAYVVLALAVVSIGFALANIPKLLWVSGTATSVVLVLVLVSFLLKQSDARAAMRDLTRTKLKTPSSFQQATQQIDESFRNLGTSLESAALADTQLSWGCFVLGLGVSLIFTGAYLSREGDDHWENQ
jgi:hypothetical protein